MYVPLMFMSKVSYLIAMEMLSNELLMPSSFGSFDAIVLLLPVRIDLG